MCRLQADHCLVMHSRNCMGFTLEEVHDLHARNAEMRRAKTSLEPGWFAILRPSIVSPYVCSQEVDGIERPQGVHEAVYNMWLRPGVPLYRCYDGNLYYYQAAE